MGMVPHDIRLRELTHRSGVVLLVLVLMVTGATTGALASSSSQSTASDTTTTAPLAPDGVTVTTTNTTALPDDPEQGEWTLLGTDPDDAPGPNIESIESQRQDDAQYFKIDYYGTPSTEGFATTVLLDTDQDPTTGFNSDDTQQHVDNVGAEFAFTFQVTDQSAGGGILVWDGTTWVSVDTLPMDAVRTQQGTVVAAAIPLAMVRELQGTNTVGEMNVLAAHSADTTQETPTDYVPDQGDGHLVTGSETNELSPVVGTSPPTDPDADGHYEDVNGDGIVNINDVQALFANLDAAVVQNNPSAFDFNGDGSVNIIDVQQLFTQLT
jgi:hypothetical protein